MPFSKDNPPPSRKGKKNKMTGAHGDLLAAWDKEAGPQTARDLMRSAIDDAKGRESVVVDRRGVAHEIIIKDWDPLRVILPYIAKRLESGSVSVEGNNITVKVVNYGQQDAE